MQRGGMRWTTRAVALAGVVLMVVVAAGACQNGPQVASSPTSLLPSTSAPATPSGTYPPADPLVTAQVCGLALAATATTISVFADKSAAQELAVAQGDNTTALTLAEEIDEQFESIETTFTELSLRAIDPALRDRLIRTATALGEMSSDYYTGSNYEVQIKLLEFQSGLVETCAQVAPSTEG